MTFLNKNEEFWNHPIKKVLTTISGMPHQLFEAGIHKRDIYRELKEVLLLGALKCDMRRVFNNKIWFMDICMIQHSS